MSNAGIAIDSLDFSDLRTSQDRSIIALLVAYDAMQTHYQEAEAELAEARACIVNLESEARSLEYLHGKAVDERDALAAELAKAQVALRSLGSKI
jgi:chromosome segregation ATPase